MVRLDGCQRCHGDLIFEGKQGLAEDTEEWVCLQCGNRVYNETPAMKRLKNFLVKNGAKAA